MPWSAAQPLTADAAQIRELERIERARSTPQKVALRARIVLRGIQGDSNHQIAEEFEVPRPTVILWRQRFADHGVDGILSDATRPGRRPKISAAKVAAVVEATLNTKPKGATHWSTREMARTHRLSQSTVARIWQAHGLKPHLVERFKLSEDPEFEAKLRDIVGLYLNPPHKALVLCVDEKTQIQALDRTRPILPLRPGLAERQTHDYRRNATTDLFAALNVLTGRVIGRCYPRHTAAEFISFLKVIDRQTPNQLTLHLIVDNASTHDTPDVRDWRQAHPRFVFHFTPTSGSWLNLVERFFAQITTKQIRRGTFRNVAELTHAIREHIQVHNKHPKPFTWHAAADQILAKGGTRQVTRCKEALDRRLAASATNHRKVGGPS